MRRCQGLDAKVREKARVFWAAAARFLNLGHRYSRSLTRSTRVPRWPPDWPKGRRSSGLCGLPIRARAPLQATKRQGAVTSRNWIGSTSSVSTTPSGDTLTFVSRIGARACAGHSEIAYCQRCCYPSTHDTECTWSRDPGAPHRSWRRTLARSTSRFCPRRTWK